MVFDKYSTKDLDGGRIAIYKNVRWVPVLDPVTRRIKRKPNGDQIFRKFDVTFEDEDNKSWYEWDPISSDLYYRRREKNDEIFVRTNLTGTLRDVVWMIASGEIKWDDGKNRTKRPIGPRITVTSNWCVEYDNQPVLLLVMQKPKMSYQEILDVIKAEGGSVDEQGIIHKGTATNKIVEVK